jgi:integrase
MSYLCPVLPVLLVPDTYYWVHYANLWIMPTLPLALTSPTACDRRTKSGRRDFAILTLLVRLGLRAGEVAALALDDIDWRAGEMVVYEKGKRADRLPLPTDVGEAIAAYLRRGRRANAEVRSVFVRLPAMPPASPTPRP